MNSARLASPIAAALVVVGGAWLASGGRAGTAALLPAAVIGALASALIGAAPRGRAWPLAAAALSVASGAWFYAAAGRDDVHITYWVAHALATRGAPLNLNLDWVEQSSSLLQVLLLAPLAALPGADLVTLGGALAVLAGAATVVFTASIAPRVGVRHGLAAATVLGLAPGFTYWSWGGLETSLAALVLCALVAACGAVLDGGGRRAWAATAALLLAFVMVRPEALFVVLAACAALAVAVAWGARSRAGMPTLSRVAALGALAVLLFGLLAAWRHHAYGAFFPQPVAAKAAGLDPDRALAGVDYLGALLGASPTLAVVLLAATGAGYAVLRPGARAPGCAMAAAAFLAASLAFVVASGGDWMEGGRFVVPLLPLAVLLAARALAGLRRGAPLLLSLAALGFVVETVIFAGTQSTGALLPHALAQARAARAVHGDGFSWFEVANRVHLRDIPVVRRLDAVVGERLATQPQVTVLSAQMGMVPYHLARHYAGRVRFVDRRALASADFTRCAATRDVPRTWAGLELDYAALFLGRPGLLEACGIARPDVVFDLEAPGGPVQRLLERQGYVIVYRHGGVITTPGGGGEVLADQFIAVRRAVPGAAR